MDDRQAIEILDNGISYTTKQGCLKSTAIIDDPELFQDAIDHAIAVMQTEPCEWCDGVKRLEVMTLSVFSDDVLPEIESKQHTRKRARFCPNCGRKLKEGDDKPKAEPATYKAISVDPEEAAKWQTMRSDEVWG